jgi:glycosylphosphatidylinositol transamidase (GPIT) subunit GPI8
LYNSSTRVGDILLMLVTQSMASLSTSTHDSIFSAIDRIPSNNRVNTQLLCCDNVGDVLVDAVASPHVLLPARSQSYWRHVATSSFL